MAHRGADYLAEEFRREADELRQEVEVLTQERDNALLRVEEILSDRDAETERLQDRIEELERKADYWRDTAREALGVDPSARGGVHPNA